jgi:hypothetical protein
MIFSRNLTICLLLTILIAGCGVSKKRNKEVAATGNDWYLKNYTYADGNANRYVFSKNGFEYFPVSPAESSSGSYDGGRYIKKLPDLNQFYELVDIIKASFEATVDHNQNREKGTGLIEVRGVDNNLVNTWILKYNAPSQEKLEAQLKLMKGIP